MVDSLNDLTESMANDFFTLRPELRTKKRLANHIRQWLEDSGFQREIPSGTLDDCHRAFEHWHDDVYQEKPVWNETRNLYEEFAHHMAWMGFKTAWFMMKHRSEIRLNDADMRETFRKMEAWIERYETWYSQCAQLIDGFRGAAITDNSWSDWDQGVRDEHAALYRALSELSPYIKMPLLERESIDDQWPELKAETQKVLTWAHNVMMSCDGLPSDDNAMYPIQVFYLRILCESVDEYEKALSDRTLNYVTRKSTKIEVQD